MARGKINNTFINSGVPAAGSYDVFLRGTGTHASLFTAESGGSSVANPGTLNAFGRINAWVAEGSYDVQITGTGFTTFIVPVEIFRGDRNAAILATVLAPPTGVTATDTSIIQTALTAGGLLIAQSGLYVINTTLTIPGATTFRGAGKYRTKLQAHSTLSGPVITNAGLAGTEAGSTGNSQVAIEDLSIDGNKSARGTGSTEHGIWFRGGAIDPCYDLRLKNLEVHDCHGLGMPLQNCQGVEVTGCHSHDHDRDGITCYWNCQDVRIENNQVNDCADDFIGLNGEDSTTTGHTLSDITITGNILGGGGSGAGTCVSISGAKRVSVTGNTMREGFSDGIVLRNWNTTSTSDVTISGNIIEAAGANNTGAAGHAIEFNQGAASFSQTGTPADILRVTIANNVIHTPRTHGILFTPSHASATIRDIVIKGNIMLGGTLSATANGIVCSSATGTVSDLTIEGNLIREWQRQGIILSAANIKRVQILGNKLVSNGQNGATNQQAIYLNGIDDVLVEGNRCYNASGATQTYGITLASPVGTWLVTGNKFDGNATGAIERGTLSATTWIENNISDTVPTVASAATITVTDIITKISGTADITSVSAGPAKKRITLIFTGTAAATGVTDGSNLKLNGNFAYTPDDCLTLVSDGTNWYEVGRSAN